MKYFFIFLILSFKISAEVIPPNYDFKLTELDIFFPGKKLAEIKTKWGEGEIIEKGSVEMRRFQVTATNYQVIVLAQIQNEVVIDFYARLPSYFLHDVFHQSLINKIGKQNQYLLDNETAIYKWNNVQGLEHTYASTCTITCFPIYYTVNSGKAGGKSLQQKFLEFIK
jgi:hypothetical protein